MGYEVLFVGLLLALLFLVGLSVAHAAGWVGPKNDRTTEVRQGDEWMKRLEREIDGKGAHPRSHDG